ncbi:MAG: tyrosine-type recombinase/integrase [Fimbriimonadaceae bacterium]|nr:tyrosine-type recombinase/integrase [Chitinophagales bacterium]
MHLNGFFSYLQFEKRYSHHTVEAYRSDIAQFTEFLKEHYQNQDDDLLAATHRNVRSWIISLMDNSISAKSVNRKISSLKSYFRFLIKQGIIKKNPMLKIASPKTPKTLPLFVDKKGMEAVFNFIDTIYPFSTPVEKFIQVRDKFIVELLYGTGIRRSELISLSEKSFDYSKKTVKVLGKGNKERILPVGKKIMQLYNEYIQQRNFVFGKTENLFLSNTGKKANTDLIYKVVHNLLSENTTLTRKSPHVLRHTFATHLSNNGAELNAVKELLGHATLASTQVYTHNTIDKLKEIHRLAHPKA